MIVSNAGFPEDIRVYREAIVLAKSFRVSVIGWDRTCKRKGHEFTQGIEVIRIKRKSSYGNFGDFLVGLPVFWFQCIIYLIKLKVDIVHCHDLDTLPAGVLLKFFNPKLKVVFDSHEHYPSMISKKVPAFLAKIVGIFFVTLPRLADGVIVVNDYLASCLSKCKKVTILMNCPQLDESNKPISLSSNQDGFKVFYFGSLSENKGIYTLLKAAEQRSNIKLLIAGDGPAKEDIIKSSKSHPNISYFGWISYQQILNIMAISDLIPILYFADVLNNKIATPNKLFLAMRFGKPVVVFTGSLTEKIVKKEQMGDAIHEDNVAELLTLIDDLIENPSKLEYYGKNGNDAFHREYNWQVMQNRLTELYNNIEY
jgi:glycosyltransferase involved in cell wall biosynthesis